MDRSPTVKECDFPLCSREACECVLVSNGDLNDPVVTRHVIGHASDIHDWHDERGVFVDWVLPEWA